MSDGREMFLHVDLYNMLFNKSTSNRSNSVKVLAFLLSNSLSLYSASSQVQDDLKCTDYIRLINMSLAGV